MATIINNDSQPAERTLVTQDTTGWAIAIIVLLAVIIGGIYLWTHMRSATPAPQQPGASINVSLPTPEPTPTPTPTPQANPTPAPAPAH